MRNTPPLWKRAAWTALAATAFIYPVAAHAQDMAALRAQDAPANSLWLDALDLANVTQDYGSPHAGKSVDNNALTLSGVAYPHGLGTHAVSRLLVNLKGSATKFEALTGVDDEKKGSGSVQFQVFVDGKKKAETPVLHGGDAPVPVSVDLTGAKRMTLVVTDAGDGNDSDHADWAGALLTLVPGAVDKPITAPDAVTDEPPMPIFMGADSPVPAIHGPRITGATPGKPFEFMIPATGEGPLAFEAANLPAGLTLDKSTGIISGVLPGIGSTKVKLTVRGPRGSSSRSLTIVGGQPRAGPDAADGLELVERLGGPRGRREGPGRRRPAHLGGLGRARLPVRQH